MTKPRVHIFFVLLWLLLASACAPTEVPIVLPTLAELPTLTPSNTPTFTPTHTETATTTPTNTATQTLRPSATVTASVTPSPTFTVTLTPTFTLTHTATITPSPSPSATHTPTATSAAPSVARMDVQPTQVEPGDVVTLQWIADGEEARLDLLNSAGVSIQSITLPPRGSQSITIPNTYTEDLLIFRITARRGTLTDEFSIPITVDGDCRDEWFFASPSLVEETFCPTGTPVAVTGRYQDFSNGYAVYVPNNNLNRVYFFYQGNTIGSFLYTLPETRDNSLGSVPSGFMNPQQEFEGVWADQVAPSGRTWVNEIGWADSNADSRTITLQYAENTDQYIIDAGGVLFRVNPNDNQANIGQYTRLR